MKIALISIIVVLVFGVLIFLAKGSSNQTSVSNHNIQSIQSDIASGGQLIDVRTAAEYADGHIEGAINLSLQDIQAGANPTAAKDKPVYVYCRSGSRSSQAAAKLKANGYQNIIDLGSMTRVRSLGGVIKT